VHSLSKQSNLAGYRAGFVAGDPALVAASCWRCASTPGMIVPAPGAGGDGRRAGDDAHVAEQRERYAARRRRAARRAGPRASGSTTPRPGSTCGRPATRTAGTTVDWLAERGILVAPGEFYGPAGARHVRVALTATDERVGAWR
jgi:aspartate/methionine/tyrosine aminotransferase